MMVKEMVELLKGEAGGDLDLAEFREFMMTRPSLLKAMFPVVVCDFCRRNGLGDFKSVSDSTGGGGDEKGADGKKKGNKKGGKKKGKGK